MQGNDNSILAYSCDACKWHFASRFAYDQYRRSKFSQGTPCFTAVEQLRELVATQGATAMLGMASVSRAVGTKLCVNDRILQFMNMPCIFGINNINIRIMRGKPGLVPSNPSFNCVIYIAVIINLILTSVQNNTGYVHNLHNSAIVYIMCIKCKLCIICIIMQGFA